MKQLISIALLALFGVVIFIPDQVLSTWLYWSLFVLMFVLLGAYWFVSYWVSYSSAVALINEKPRFTLYCAKVPVASTEDLVRGRLVITEKQVYLVQKVKPKGNRTTYKIVWSVSASAVCSISFGKVLGMRAGMILELDDDVQERFVSTTARKKKALIKQAFGWDVSPDSP